MCLRLVDESQGKLNESVLKTYFGDPKFEICVGKSTIDMMIFNTTTGTARLSRGSAYGESWKDFQLAPTNKSQQ